MLVGVPCDGKCSRVCGAGLWVEAGVEFTELDRGQIMEDHV